MPNPDLSKLTAGPKPKPDVHVTGTSPALTARAVKTMAVNVDGITRTSASAVDIRTSAVPRKTSLDPIATVPRKPALLTRRLQIDRPQHLRKILSR